MTAALLEAARGGSEDAFASLIEPYRRELQAHCYRMLGSVYDAEDALQETMLRAWKALGRFEERSSLRSWLYRIATNASLDAISKRPKRVLPIDYGPATDPALGPGEPVVESIWIEPYPDAELGLPDEAPGPEALYEQREAIELAFIAALQHLPALQRAVLIMREVLGYSAREVAKSLETTEASVNSALQRARAAVSERTGERSQQATLQALGDAQMRRVVEQYTDAWERNDLEAVVGMLTDDAAIAMPPLATWFGRTPEAMRAFLAGYPLSGIWRWKTLVTTANAQPAIGFYAWDEAAGTHLPFALNVLSFRGDKICDIVAFVSRSIAPTEREAYHRWVDQPIDPDQVFAAFGRFGLPDRLD